MRPVKPTFRAAAISALVVASLGVACGSKAQPSGATSAPGAAGGAPATGGVAGTVAVAGVTSGAAGTGAAGVTDSTGGGGAGAIPGSGTVPSGAGGTVDQGHLFTDAAAVTTAPADAAAPTPEVSSGADSGASSAPGDGNTSTCHVGGMSFVLVFTQKGTDVTMVATAMSCPAGSHTIQLHGGFSCDNAGTEGGVWDGMRGAGIPALTCANNKGTLTYTRSGADPTTSWTVGDHATKTDVTLHPMSVDTSCGTFF